MVETPEEGALLFARGFDFIAVGTDTQLYVNALRSGLRTLRAECE